MLFIEIAYLDYTCTIIYYIYKETIFYITNFVLNIAFIKNK